MYIIENDEIKDVECLTLGMSTGLDLTEFNWIRNRINNSGIFYFNEVTYYKYYSVVEYVLKNPHLKKLNSINNIIIYINTKIEFYTNIKNVLDYYNSKDIVKKYSSLKMLIDNELLNINFFIGYTKHMLQNEHVGYCNKIVKNNEIIDILDKISNLVNIYEYETIFLRDLNILTDFDIYSNNILETINKMITLIEESITINVAYSD